MFWTSKNPDLPPLLSFLGNIPTFKSLQTSPSAQTHSPWRPQLTKNKRGCEVCSSQEGKVNTSAALCPHSRKAHVPQDRLLQLLPKEGLPISDSSCEIQFYEITLKAIYGPE